MIIVALWRCSKPGSRSARPLHLFLYCSIALECFLLAEMQQDASVSGRSG